MIIQPTMPLVPWPSPPLGLPTTAPLHLVVDSTSLRTVPWKILLLLVAYIASNLPRAFLHTECSLLMEQGMLLLVGCSKSALPSSLALTHPSS
jgi:hypothetical protein